jgi:hypothetical protein
MAVSALATLEGSVNAVFHFHYGITGDVLYLRVVDTPGRDSYSEETDDGFLLVHDMETDQPVGITVIGYWKRSGDRRALGKVSLSELDARAAGSAEEIARHLDAA